MYSRSSFHVLFFLNVVCQLAFVLLNFHVCSVVMVQISCYMKIMMAALSYCGLLVGPRWCLHLLSSVTNSMRRGREGERSVSMSSTLPTELQLDSCCVSAKPMVPLCPSIGVPLSTRHCPLCALQPRTDYCLSCLLWASVNCIRPLTTSAKSSQVHCPPLCKDREL